MIIGGIEISTWNKSNIVTFVDCDCGQLAKRELRKHNQFKCEDCKKNTNCIKETMSQLMKKMK